MNIDRQDIPNLVIFSLDKKSKKSKIMGCYIVFFTLFCYINIEGMRILFEENDEV